MAFTYNCLIPTTDATQLHLLVSGYCRNYSPAQSSEVNNLCANYTKTIYTIDDIRNAKPEESFYSPIFIYAGCKWIIQYNPRELSEDTTVPQSMGQLYLILISCAPNCQDITYKYEFSVPQFIHQICQTSETVCKSLSSFKSKLPIQPLCLLKIHSALLNNIKTSISCSLQLTVTEITTQDYEQILIDKDTKFTNLSTKHIIDCFKWVIDIKKPKSVLFKMHSLCFCVQLHPNNSQLEIKLLSSANLHVACFIDIICVDIQWKYKAFFNFKKYSTVEIIDADELDIDSIEAYEMQFITMDLSITILDIFDEKANNVTNDFIDNHQPSQQLLPVHYTWKIPEFTDNEAIILCNGYIREKCDNNLYIPYDISRVIFLFFDDRTVIQHIQNAKTGHGFRSKIFNILGFKWYLDIYPRGYDEYSGMNEGQSFINLVSLSPEINKIATYFKIKLCELDILNETTGNFKQGHPCEDALSFPIESIKNVEKLTFKFELFILNVLNIKGESMVNYYRKYHSNMICECLMNEYEWNVNEHLMINKENIMSEAFNMHMFKWKLELIKSTSTRLEIKLFLLTLNEIKVKIWLNIIILCEDIDGKYLSEGVEFCDTCLEHSVYLSKDFDRDRDCKFKLIIQLMDVFDENGYCITSKYRL